MSKDNSYFKEGILSEEKQNCVDYKLFPVDGAEEQRDRVERNSVYNFQCE